MINPDSYKVGPLLYMPALRNDIAEKISEAEALGLTSTALCLEDTIRDDMVEHAEYNLKEQFYVLDDMVRSGRLSEDKLPMIFVRVRSPYQLEKMNTILGDNSRYLYGFILPKIDDENIGGYLDTLNKINKFRSKKYCIMPIIENPSLIRPDTRHAKLRSLYEQLMTVQDTVLNVRIGGNDFCNTLALRADINHTIYDIPPIAALLSDISAVFAGDFIVSAPVWNYFENGTDDRWKQGLIKEITGDKAMGFVGKTVIHPCQVTVAREAMKISRTDYEDARLVLEQSGEVQVLKSINGGRMYENKVHSKWAEKTIALAEAYGIYEDQETYA